MWRLSRLIVQRPPGIMQRTMCGPNFVQVRPFQAAYNAAHMPPAPTWLEPDILQQWAAKPLSSLLQFMADQGLAAPGMAVVSTAQGAAHLMCSAFQAQEQSLLWCVLRYAELVAGPQLEKDLGSLLGADARIQLGQLPVFAMGLGQVLKSNRSLMWAYCVFRTQQVSAFQVGRRARGVRGGGLVVVVGLFAGGNRHSEESWKGEGVLGLCLVAAL